MQKIDGRRDDLIDTYRPQLDNKMIHRIRVNEVACMNIEPANSSSRTWTTKEYSDIALPSMVNARHAITIVRALQLIHVQVLCHEGCFALQIC